MRPLVAALSAVLLSSVAAAQPSVNEVYGTFANDSTVTILGSGFGDKATPGPHFYDTIDNQSAYDGVTVATGELVPVSGDVADGCPDCPWYATSPYSTGPYFTIDESGDLGVRVSGRPMYYANRSGVLRGRNPSITVDENDTVYLSWWYKSNYYLYDSPGGRVFNKLIRYTADTGNLSWQDQIEIEAQGSYGTEVGCLSAGQRWYDSWPERPIDIYHHIEFIVVGGGDMVNGSGRFSMWLDGQLVTDRATVYSCYGMLDVLYIWGSDPSTPELYPADTKVVFGELYYDSTQSRVVIGDASTLAASSHREIQPATAWSPTSITIDFNAGTFGNNDVAYVYVVDADGNVNSAGVPVTISGQTGPPDSSPPGAPTNLHAVEND